MTERQFLMAIAREAGQSQVGCQPLLDRHASGQ
jgi:hypothetical protein